MASLLFIPGRYLLILLVSLWFLSWFLVRFCVYYFRDCV